MSQQVVVHMATVCRMALAAIGLTISHFFKHGHRNHFAPLVKAPFPEQQAGSQSGKAFAGQRALTIKAG